MRKNKKLKEAMALLRGHVSPAQYTQVYGSITVVLEKASEEQLAAIQAVNNTEQIGAVLNSILETLVTPQVSVYLPYIYTEIDWRVLSKLIDAITDLQPSHDIINKPGYLYESYLHQFVYNSGSEYFTPTAILNLILDSIPPKDGMSVYDPCCSVGNVFAAASKRANISSFGQEINPNAYLLAQISSFLYDLPMDLGTHATDTLHHDLHAGRKADLVISNPPFNQSWLPDEQKSWAYGVAPKSNANYAWLQIMLEHLTADGRMAAVLPIASLASASKAEREIRKRFVEEGLIDIIITLEKDHYFSTNIPCSIWFISKKASKNVLFLHSPAPMPTEKIVHAASRFLQGEAVNKTGFCATVCGEDIAAKKYSLSPAVYITSPLSETTPDIVHTDTLSALANWKYGQSRTDTQTGSYPVYSASGQYRWTDAPDHQGPAIILGRKHGIGNVFFEDGKFSASETVLYATEFSNLVLPEYLYFKLKSIDFTAYNTGTAIASLTLKPLHHIQVTIPDIQTQRKIVTPLLLLQQKIAVNLKLIDVLSSHIEEKYHRFCRENDMKQVKLGSIFQIVRGKTYKQAGAVPWFSIRDMDAPYLFHPQKKQVQDLHGLIPPDTVLVSYKLTQGRVGITTESCAINEAIAAFLTDRNDINEYLYCWLKSLDFRQFGSNSSIGTSMRIRTLREISFPLPADSALLAFQTEIKPLFAQIKQFLIENIEAEKFVKKTLEAL